MSSIEHLEAFARADRGLAVIAFGRPDQTVHQSLVNAGVMAHPVSGDMTVAFVVRGNALKLRVWRDTPKGSIVFRSGWAWIGVEGDVTIVGPDDPHPGYDAAGLPMLLRDVFTAAGGTHDDWDEYDRVMAEERRAAVFIHPQRIRGNGTP